MTPREYHALMTLDTAFMNGVKTHQEEQRAKYKTQQEGAK